MRRRDDRRRIVELELANRTLAAEIKRLQAHLAVAQVFAQEGLRRRIDEEFAEQAAKYDAAQAFRQYALGLHVYGASAISTASPNLVAGL